MIEQKKPLNIDLSASLANPLEPTPSVINKLSGLHDVNLSKKY